MPETFNRGDRDFAGDIPPSADDLPRGRRAPVVLATLGSAPFDPRAASFAVEVAVESGAALIVVNAVDLSLTDRLPRHAPGTEPDEVAAALRAPAELAASFGVPVERIRVHSPRPITALLELVANARPRVLVFGPEPTRLSRFSLWSRHRYRRLVRTLQSHAPCLMWLADEQIVA